MYIYSIRIENYKSFRDSGEICFGKNFNVIVGKNNSGKTALIECCKLRRVKCPHMNPETVPSAESSPNPKSVVEAKIRFEQGEMRQTLLNSDQSFSIPYRYREETGENALDRFRECIESNEQEVKVRLEPDKRTVDAGYSEGHGTNVSTDLENRRFISVDNRTDSINYDNVAFANARNDIYFFEAERQNLGECSMGDNTNLKPDSSNLAEVLHVLQSKNPARYKKLIDKVNEVIPSVEYVTTSPTQNGSRVMVNIWNIDPSTERSDLAIPLSQSGTGVGQVLAILYVLFTSETKRVIIIDEPQSFLHPGAVRRLISVMKENPEHQYIMSTHSPSVVTACDPKNVLLTYLDGIESQVAQIDVKETEHLRRALAEIGVRLSDVFGADSILWVEGPTEELCFPRLIEELADTSLLGTEVVGVRNPGDFEGRYAQEVVRLYRKLTQGRSLIPPAVAFLFDREDRSPTELEDLRRLDARVMVTDRRMFENYLIHPEAIAEVLTKASGEEASFSAQDVESWIEENAGDFDAGNDYPSDQWYREVDAASLLEELFRDLAQIPFQKTNHVPKLTEWLISNDPSELHEITDKLETALEVGPEGKGGSDIAEAGVPVNAEHRD